tara:strand:+ start:744 stop:1259 length:516 start_codon:yes stop_codon:yes gene_type:complete
MKNMAYWKRKNALPGINHESDKNMPDGRAKSSPLQKDVKTKKKPYATSDDTKEGNVSAYFRENKQYVDKDKTTPLDPGFEDIEKIQKVQKEGLTPYSQNFGPKKKKEGPVKNKEDRKRSRIEHKREKKIYKAEKRAEKQHSKLDKRKEKKLSRAYKRQEKKAGGPNIDEID